MKYVRAYAQAWWTLFCWASVANISIATLLFVFTPWRLGSVVLTYTFYVVSVAAVGGVVREGMDK